MSVDEEKVVSSSKKRKLSKTSMAKFKANQKKRMSKGSDEEEDAYTAVSKSLWASNIPKPPVGDFEDCATCSKQFTVVSAQSLFRSYTDDFQTKYTLASSTGDGFLCHQCAKAGGNDPFKKPAASSRRKAPSAKRNFTSFQERRFPTLVSLCVRVRHSYFWSSRTLFTLVGDF